MLRVVFIKEFLMETRDLFATPFYKYRNPQVEQLLVSEGFEFELKELPKSTLHLIDIAQLQTRDVQGKENFVDKERVELMVETLKNGDVLPAVILFFVNNKYIALDGRHRIESHKIAGSISFVAYVIDRIDEAKIWINGLRLSNLINEMNGERAGKDNQEKANRTVTVELCAGQMFSLISSGENREKVIEETLTYHKISAGATIRRVKNLLAKHELKLGLLDATSGPAAEKLVDGIHLNEMQLAQSIMQRCEPASRLKIAETINAVKNNGTAHTKVLEVLKNNQNNAPSTITARLQETAGLDQDNKKMAVAESAHLAKQVELRKAMSNFFRHIGYRVPFFGQDKHTLLKDLNNGLNMIQVYKNHLENM
jgi:hypothetical protein